MESVESVAASVAAAVAASVAASVAVGAGVDGERFDLMGCGRSKTDFVRS